MMKIGVFASMMRLPMALMIQMMISSQPMINIRFGQKKYFAWTAHHNIFSQFVYSSRGIHMSMNLNWIKRSQYFTLASNLKVVMGQWIYVHWKIRLKSNLQHFTESCFTLVIYCEFSFMSGSCPIHVISSILCEWSDTEIEEIDKLFTQNHDKWWKSSFTDLTFHTSEISFMIDLRKFCS